MAVIDSRSPGVLSVLSEENAEDPTDKLRVFVSQATGLPLELVRRRYLRKPGTRPSLDTNWCSLCITNVITHGTPLVVGKKGQIENPESAYSRTETHQTLNVSVEFYGDNAAALADRFRDSCGLFQNGATLLSQGLTLQGVDEDVNRYPDFAFEQFCDRYEVRFRVGRKLVRTYGIRDFAALSTISIITDKLE